MPLLPIVNGVVYPCAIPPADTGEYLEADDTTHLQLVEAWNQDRLAFSVDGDETLLTKEFQVKVQQELSQHPAMVALQARIEAQQEPEPEPLKDKLKKNKKDEENNGNHDVHDKEKKHDD